MKNSEKGKIIVDDFLKKYGDIPLKDFDNIRLSEFISESDKTKSALIKKMQDKSNTPIETLAAYLGCNTQSLRNKLFRNSFSIDDLLIAAYACNFSVVLRNNSNGENIVIDLVDFFKPMNDDVLVRISDLDKEAKKAKQAEYEQLKAKLKEMKDTYGFD